MKIPHSVLKLPSHPHSFIKALLKPSFQTLGSHRRFHAVTDTKKVMHSRVKDNLPVLSGKVRGKKVAVLRDTGCGGVIIRKELVDETDFTGEMGHIMTVDHTIKRAPMAKLEVDTPFYVGTCVEVLCLQDPLFDLIIGNVPGARRLDDPNPEWGVVTAVAT